MNPTWEELQAAVKPGEWVRLECVPQITTVLGGLGAFSKVLDELKAMHDKKNQDYGRDTDPYANVRGSQEWGISPWVGAMVRGNDKMKRLQKAAQGGTLANEGVEDSLLDLAVYSIIALILFREGAK